MNDSKFGVLGEVCDLPISMGQKNPVRNPEHISYVTIY